MYNIYIYIYIYVGVHFQGLLNLGGRQQVHETELAAFRGANNTNNDNTITITNAKYYY